MFNKLFEGGITKFYRFYENVINMTSM